MDYIGPMNMLMGHIVLIRSIEVRRPRPELAIPFLSQEILNYIQIDKMKHGLGVILLIPALRQTYLYEFKARLSYKMSSRTTRPTQKSNVSKIKKQEYRK